MKRGTKKAKKDVVENRSVGAFISSSDHVNETDEKKLIGVHYKELCNLTNRLTTQAALTSGTFEMVKKGLLSLIEDVDTYFENERLNQTTHGLKFSIDDNMLSREVVKLAHATKESEREANENDPDSNELVIKGLKMKQKKPVKSSKRLKSGLETRVRKKKQNHAKQNGNNVPDIDNIGDIPNPSNSFEHNSFPAQVSQPYHVRTYPIVGLSLALESFQITPVAFPTNEQSNFCWYSRTVQESERSLTRCT